MAASAAIASAVIGGIGTLNAMGAREDAKAQAAQQREALAALEAKDTPVLPDPNDEASRKARQRSISSQMRRRGRSSTILTNQEAGSDALGNA